MRQTISAIPDELLETSPIDGASEFWIFWRIALPLCRPTLATPAVLNVVYRRGPEPVPVGEV